jgi:hypothetical protein
MVNSNDEASSAAVERLSVDIIFSLPEVMLFLLSRSQIAR